MTSLSKGLAWRMQSTDLNTALIDLFSACFVFDIAYPFEVAPILIFLQHYVFALTLYPP